MVITHTKEGAGAQPKATDQVKVHYEGRLIDGARGALAESEARFGEAAHRETQHIADGHEIVSMGLHDKTP